MACVKTTAYRRLSETPTEATTGKRGQHLLRGIDIEQELHLTHLFSSLHSSHNKWCLFMPPNETAEILVCSL